MLKQGVYTCPGKSLFHWLILLTDSPAMLLLRWPSFSVTICLSPAFCGVPVYAAHSILHLAKRFIFISCPWKWFYSVSTGKCRAVSFYPQSKKKSCIFPTEGNRDCVSLLRNFLSHTTQEALWWHWHRTDWKKALKTKLHLLMRE